MKVLHVIPSVSPLRGGPSFAVPAMARGLAQAGLQVHIATTDDNGTGHLDVPLGRPGVRDDVTYWYFRRQTRFYTASWPLTRWLARHVRDYDLLHIHCLFSYPTLAAAFWAYCYGVPYVLRPLGTLTRWGMHNRRPLLKRLSMSLIERHILRNAMLIHYTSEQERLEAEEIGVDGPAAVIPLGIDVARFMTLPPHRSFTRRYPQLDGKYVFLFLSRLDPKKGLDLLLPAFKQLSAQQDAALVLAGDGKTDFVERVRAEAVRLGLNNSIVWTGFLQGQQKLAALADADAFVLPSYSENFGIAVVEALACGLPVVISDQVAIHQEILRADAGLVVPCRVDRLVSAMKALVTDPDIGCRIGAKGQQLVRNHFSVEVMTERLEQSYRDVLVYGAGR